MTLLAMASNNAVQLRLVLGLSGAGVTLTARFRDKEAGPHKRKQLLMKPEKKCTLQLVSKYDGADDCYDDYDDD